MSTDNSAVDGLFLEGVRVIDLTRLLPGPFATMLLADMGADVIKVESPGIGDYARHYPPTVGESGAFFQSVNRNKRFVTMNLKMEAGRDLLKRLLKDADVLLESFRPGVMTRLGLDIEKLRQEFPGLVICSISGYGQSGPKRSAAGHDANYLALSGVLSQNGQKNQTPHLPGFQLADIAGGALYAALGITSALFRRERTGQGAWLDISMTEGALSFMIPAIARAQAGEPEARGDGMLSGGLPCYRVYSTSDDRYLAVGALEPKFWDPFVQAIGAPELQGRGLMSGEDGEEIGSRVQEILSARPLEHWVTLFNELDICVEPVLEFEELLESELHRARDVFFDLQGVTHVRTPLTAGNVEHRGASAQGADNDEVFRASGVTDEELASLKDNGVI